MPFSSQRIFLGISPAFLLDSRFHLATALGYKFVPPYR
jgi:hypothetical protein